IGANGIFDRQFEAFAGESDALQAAVLDGGGLPAAQPGEVKIPIGRIEASAHHTGKKAAGQGNRGGLDWLRTAVAEKHHHRAAAIGEVEHLACERPPNSVWNPNLAASGIVDVARNPTKRPIETGGSMCPLMHRGVAIKTSRMDQ